MTDKQIIEIVVECAKLYRDNLEKYNIMFVFKNNQINSKKEKIEFIETIYYPTNFLHLTGLKSKYYTSTNFYYYLLNGKLSINDIEYSTNRILAILKKERKDKLYNNISYLCKDFNFNIFSENKELIEFNNLKIQNEKYADILKSYKK